MTPTDEDIEAQAREALDASTDPLPPGVASRLAAARAEAVAARSRGRFVVPLRWAAVASAAVLALAVFVVGPEGEPPASPTVAGSSPDGSSAAPPAEGATGTPTESEADDMNLAELGAELGSVASAEPEARPGGRSETPTEVSDLEVALELDLMEDLEFVAWLALEDVEETRTDAG